MKKDDDADWRSLERFAFGDSPELADELAELVLAAKSKRPAGRRAKVQRRIPASNG